MSEDIYFLNNRFKVLKKIGHGQSASIYKAIDTTVGQDPITLKVWHSHLLIDPISVKRLENEYKILKFLRHQNIIMAHEIIKTESQFAIVMEYIQGENLKDYVEKKIVGIEGFIKIAVQVIDAMQFCHSNGILHRDLKPENILINLSGQIKIIDFGVSLLSTEQGLTKTGALLGTPIYLAPEIFMGERASEASEVYSIGAIFYWLLAREPHIESADYSSKLTEKSRNYKLQLSQMRSDVPVWIIELISQMLHFQKAHRYTSTLEVKKAFFKKLKNPKAAQISRLSVPCNFCGTPLFENLNFCYSCLNTSDLSNNKGNSSLIITKTGNTAKASHFIYKVLQSAKRLAPKSIWKKPPFILISGLDRHTANYMSQVLYELGFHSEVYHQKKYFYKLPKTSMLFCLWPFLFFISEQFSRSFDRRFIEHQFYKEIIIYVFLSFLSLWIYHYVKSKPIINLKTIQKTKESFKDYFNSSLKKHMTTVHDTNLRYLIAKFGNLKAQTLRRTPKSQQNILDEVFSFCDTVGILQNAQTQIQNLQLKDIIKNKSILKRKIELSGKKTHIYNEQILKLNLQEKQILELEDKYDKTLNTLYHLVHYFENSDLKISKTEIVNCQERLLKLSFELKKLKVKEGTLH